jgi:DNA-binding MarR family transcriptional regulator
MAVLSETVSTPPELLAKPGFLTRRLYQAYVSAWVRTVDGTLTGPQFAVLVAVNEQPGLDQRSLAQAVSLDTSTMADVARRLETRGLICRVADPTDGRRKLLELTPEGVRVLEDVDRRARALDELLLAGLDESARTEVLTTLRVLSDRWAKLPSIDTTEDG